MALALAVAHERVDSHRARPLNTPHDAWISIPLRLATNGETRAQYGVGRETACPKRHHQTGGTDRRPGHVVCRRKKLDPVIHDLGRKVGGLRRQRAEQAPKMDGETVVCRRSTDPSARMGHCLVEVQPCGRLCWLQPGNGHRAGKAPRSGRGMTSPCERRVKHNRRFIDHTSWGGPLRGGKFLVFVLGDGWHHLRVANLPAACSDLLLPESAGVGQAVFPLCPRQPVL